MKNYRGSGVNGKSGFFVIKDRAQKIQVPCSVLHRKVIVVKQYTTMVIWCTLVSKMENQ